MSNKTLKAQVKIAVRVFKDKTFESMYEPEQIAKFIKPYLKPWMKTSTVECNGKKICQVTITEEEDPLFAFCDCLDEGFLLSSTEELGEIDVARCAHGYYDFFDLENPSDESHSNYLLLKSKHILEGYAYHQAVIKAATELSVPIDYEYLKTNKHRLVNWLIDYRKISKEEAINLVNKDIPELIDAPSEYPETEPTLYSEELYLTEEEKNQRKASSLSMLKKIFGRNAVAKMGYDLLTDEHLDKLFNG